MLGKSNTHDLVVLKQVIETAAMTPMIGSTYPLNEPLAANAVRQLEEGHAQGKVLITV